MQTGLAGRVAVVAGATSGLGRAVARGLGAEGAAVAVVGRREDAAREVAAGLPRGIAVSADLTRTDDRERVIATTRRELGEIDVLVLNGGGPALADAASLDASGVAAAIELLVTPFVELVAAVLPAMRRRGWGRIVAIGSSGVQQPIEGLATSNVGRSALAGYLKTLAGEVAADGVTVNMVLPGRISTGRVESLDTARAERTGRSVSEVQDASTELIPMRRYGTPEEFASVVVFLAGIGASYLTGEQIRVDGGLVRSH